MTNETEGKRAAWQNCSKELKNKRRSCSAKSFSSFPLTNDAENKTLLPFFASD